MILDISRPVHPGMPIYPGNPAVAFEKTAEATATSSALTKITLGSHTGTHLDAPSHIAPGAAATDAYALEIFVGPCQVIDVTAVPAVITAADLPEIFQKRVLIKTQNSADDVNVFNPDFVALDESAARRLVERGVFLVGIDGPSIKKKGVKDEVHQILLNAGIGIVEGLALSEVSAGEYELLCLPLAVKGLDGAPVRAVLRSIL
jgi:arylformamidase